MTAEDQAYGGRQRHYTDPLGRRLPELERCMIRHRALQMVLIIYHAEELKRDILSGVAVQRRWRTTESPPPDGEDEPVKDSKKLKRAFAYLIEDGVLTPGEKKHMIALIDRRNGIAHHLDEVTADLSTDRFVRETLPFFPDRKSHDYETLDQLRAARRLLSDRMIAKHYMGEIGLRSLFFDATERALNADLKALDRRIRKLVRKRRDDIAALNGELSLDGTGLTGYDDPRWPDNRYDRGRLTPKGVETCYQLFDAGKSAMAVAHIMELTLASARRRERMWQAVGGPNRSKRVLADIPKARIRYRPED
ncbi:hypothetical protein [Sphingobium fuliginis]|nr:hypothetical protein [Sphingobium fuliginis]